MTQKRYTEIPKRQKCINKEEPYIGGAKDIIDDELNKPQSQVNEETNQRVSTLEEEVGPGGSVDERITVEKNRAEQAESTLDGKIAAEKTRAEGVEGGLNTRLQTVEELAEISVGGGDIGIGTAADFESSDPGDQAKVPTVGAILGGANDGVYDISARHSGQTYTDLEAALGTNGANIPQSLRKGGMSVKYVLSSDNKYVQYRLMKNQWSTTPSDWQGVDAEPTANSESMAKSGGIYNYLAKDIVDQDTTPSEKNKLIRNNGDIETANFYSIVRPIHLQKGDVIKVKDGVELYIGNNIAALFVCASDGTYQSTILSGRGSGRNIAIDYVAPADMYVGFCCGTTDATYKVYRLTEAAPKDDFFNLKNTVNGHSSAISSLDSDDKLFVSSDIYHTVSFESGKIIEIPPGGAQGSLTPTSSSASWSYGYAECKEGDKVFLNVLGGPGTSSAYGFLDKDLIVLQKSGVSARIENQTLTAPQNAAYIVVNTNNTIPDYKAYVVPPVMETLNDVVENVDGILILPSPIKVVRGYWGEFGKGTNYLNYWLCTDRIVYCLAGSYILNPNGWYIRMTKFEENNPLSESTVTADFKTKMDITASGWYAFSMRKSDYAAASLSDFPASNFHCTLDTAHKAEPYMTVNFIGGSTGDYPLGGDNTLFTTPSGKKLGIDFGGEIAVPICKQQYYKNGGLKLDYIVISHYHQDHIGGLVNGLENGWLDIEGATMFLPNQNEVDYALEHDLLDAPSVDLYERLQTALENVNVTKVYPSVDMKPYYIDEGVYLSFFNTNQSYLEGETDDYNNFSLGCYVVFGDTKICMTGDMSLMAENHCADIMLKANIMKAAHHGFDGAEAWLDPEFIRSVFPNIIIAEDGTIHEARIVDPEYSGRFAQLTWCEKNGVPYYRTNELGVIDVTVTKQNYRIDNHVMAYVRNGKNWSYDDNPIPT